jgi:hypothetical protein
MEDSKAPNCRMIVFPFLEYVDNFIEEVPILELPQYEVKVEDIIVKDVLSLYEGKDVLITSCTKDVV